MLKIAHRGNFTGVSKYENQPDYIDKALLAGYECEIDIRIEKESIVLGHDKGMYITDINWLLERSNRLWCHTKNFKALDFLLNYKELNCFWHQEDNYVITSKGFIWAYPGWYGSNIRTIAVKPSEDMDLTNFYGVCLNNFKEINYGS